MTGQNGAKNSRDDSRGGLAAALQQADPTLEVASFAWTLASKGDFAGWVARWCTQTPAAYFEAPSRQCNVLFSSRFHPCSMAFMSAVTLQRDVDRCHSSKGGYMNHGAPMK